MVKSKSVTSFDTKQVNSAFSAAKLAFDEWVGTALEGKGILIYSSI